MSELSFINSRRMAIACVREEANEVIDQLERVARGWDENGYRSDTPRHARPVSVRAKLRTHAADDFAIAKTWGP